MALKDTIAGVVDSARVFFSDDDDAREGMSAEGDALDMLRADHRRVEALFKEILAETSSMLTKQRGNIARVLDELTLHAKIEESILYPAVYEKTKRDTDERLEVLEAFEEHGSMKDLIKKIVRSAGRDESLKAKVQVLSELTDHHVREEESTFFPEARKLLGEKRLTEIGVQIEKIKARRTRAAAKKKKPKPRAAMPKKRA